MLQAFVDVSIVDGDLDLVNGAVLYLFSIFRAIRKAEDAVDVQMTNVKCFQHFFSINYFLFSCILVLFGIFEMQRLHMLAEIGIFILNALNHGAIPVSQAPGQILLPSSLYRVSLTKNDVSFLGACLCFKQKIYSDCYFILFYFVLFNQSSLFVLFL